VCSDSISADGGKEVIETRFFHPKTVLNECRSGKIRCMPPQFYILSTLSDILSGPICTAEQWKKAERLSTGAFGKRIVIPRNLGQDEDCHAVLALTGDEKYGGPIGRRHRIMGKIVEGGVSPCLFYVSEIRLLNQLFPHGQAMAASTVMINFDIFNEIETQASTHGACDRSH